jgi:hypothetical protein
MASQADLHALCNLIEQAYLIVSGDVMPPGGQESCRENLKAALLLARLMEDRNRVSIRE